MTGNSNHIRQPSERPGSATPYAALRGADTAGAPPDPAKDFAVEADRLQALRGALWTAFEAGPAAGLPNTLIDLTMAYTGALRLQLNLRAVAARVLSPKAKAAVKPFHDPKTREHS